MQPWVQTTFIFKALLDGESYCGVFRLFSHLPFLHGQSQHPYPCTFSCHLVIVVAITIRQLERVVLEFWKLARSGHARDWILNNTFTPRAPFYFRSLHKFSFLFKKSSFITCLLKHHDSTIYLKSITKSMTFGVCFKIILRYFKQVSFELILVFLHTIFQWAV